MIVMKFGGTSLGSSDAIKQSCKIVESKIKSKPLVVVSAVGGITDMLINAANKSSEGEDNASVLTQIFEKHDNIIKELDIDNSLIEPILSELKKFFSSLKKGQELTKQEMDVVQSFGERISSRIFSACLVKNNIPSKQYDAFDVGMITDDVFGSAEIINGTVDNLGKNLKNLGHVAVVTGFIGKTKDGRISTLGRGGSDYTAALIGAGVDAEAIEIWTDVDGIRRTDPRIIKDASTIENISFQEAAELAYFGAKVLHPKTIIPAMNKDIPVKVLNTFNPENPGTTIVKECKNPRTGLRAIAFKKDVIVINVCSARMLNAYGFLEELFGIFSRKNIVVDALATTEVTVSLTIDNIYPPEVIEELKEELENLGNTTINTDMSIISCVGSNLGKTPGVLGRIFNIIGSSGIHIDMVSAGASETNLSFIVDRINMNKCVYDLHNDFFNGI